MRWVDRGLEPPELVTYRLNFTQEWVDYYARLTGDEPAAYWGRFRDELGRRFHGNCGYCERQCDANGEHSGRQPTLDHFRPRSRFPRLTYEWTNWIFSCRQCNVEYKQDKWPDQGYVDPCAAEAPEYPERYFDYDDDTGELIPKAGITVDARRKANRTIRDLGLNSINLRVDRLNWIDWLKERLAERPFAEWPALFERYTEPSIEFGGITRMFMSQYLPPARFNYRPR